MSVDEILAELDQLSPDELQIVQEKLDLCREHFEETPEMLAAIDEGLRSAREEELIPIEEVEQRMKTWTFKSS
jgi:predicted transcriptional regulator